MSDPANRYRHGIFLVGLFNAGLLVLGITSCTSASSEPNSSQPNIVFVLIDDLGIEATNSYGSQGLVRQNGEVVPYVQPNLDAIAASGMTFRNAYATPSCAPTRAQFLTGRYPFRTGVTWPTLPNGPLADDEVTFAELLQQTGYHTGMAGKWNLRHGIASARSTGTHLAETRQHMMSQGFAEGAPFVGHTIHYGPATPETDYKPHQTNQWVREFVAREAATDRPFFLQYSLGLVHSPFVPTPIGIAEDDLSPDAGRPERTELHYLSMLEYADQLIGRILEQIDELGIANETVIIVAGDNGSVRRFTSRYRGRDVRGGKLGLVDTGSRVPFYVLWPGVVEAGSEYDGLTDFSDIFATVLDLAGAPSPTDRTIDGRSFARQLHGDSTPHRELVYCQAQRQTFVRNDEFKLVLQDRRDVKAGLYDVSDSPFSETLIPEAEQTPAQARQRQLLFDYYEKLRRQ